MIYIKSTGAYVANDYLHSNHLIKKSGTDSLEDALPKLCYEKSVNVGVDEVAKIELFINDEVDFSPAAVGYITIGNYFETYLIESRHQAILWVKEFLPTIKLLLESPQNSE